MFKDSHAFSGFSVNDLAKAKQFYSETLGIEVEEIKEGLTLKLAGGGRVFIYDKGADHSPASFTVLNFPVDNIDESVTALKGKGVSFEQIDFGFAKTDDNDVMRGKPTGDGPNIAWFKDPAGNTLAVLES